MKSKIINYDEATKLFHDDMTIMIGGFCVVGFPEILLDALIESDVKNLTIITNDSGNPGDGITANGMSRIISRNRVKKLIASHIGANPETSQKMFAGELELELVPQGSLAEKIRAGGYGFGGILTPTGIGTEIENGKQKIEIEGKEYLVELPLKADIALLRGSIVDELGNIYYDKATRNYNPLMAMAADIVVVAAEKIVKVGEIEPENIVTPGILVDYIVGGESYARAKKYA